MSGLLAHIEREVRPGALPVGRNSPQRPPLGLYVEQLSGTAFTAPRHENQRSWLYRLRPTAAHGPLAPVAHAGLDRRLLPADPNRRRHDPLSAAPGQDFLDGLQLVGGTGDAQSGDGVAILLYAADRPMERRALASHDGEWLFVPVQGTLRLTTELGALEVPPGHLGFVPRGMRFRVEVDGPAAGYVLENRGAALRLPELGPIGANGLASARDFEAPAAGFENEAQATELFVLFGGRLFQTGLDASPFDVVAWHGNLWPWRYDMARFNTIGTVSFDHPDPSIFTLLTSPSARPGTADVDVVIFPPRWMVAEDTFRPPWFHRNVMSEYMGLVRGTYDAKEGGFLPGGGSLHNRLSAHGPDAATHRRATQSDLAPERFDGGLAFMFETRLPLRLAEGSTPVFQPDYDSVWAGLERARI